MLYRKYHDGGFVRMIEQRNCLESDIVGLKSSLAVSISTIAVESCSS
jgi:hypothetical protein